MGRPREVGRALLEARVGNVESKLDDAITSLKEAMTDLKTDLKEAMQQMDNRHKESMQAMEARLEADRLAAESRLANERKETRSLQWMVTGTLVGVGVSIMGSIALAVVLIVLNLS